MKLPVIILTAMAISSCAAGTQNGKYPADVIRTRDGHELKITFYGHSSLMFEYLGKYIYTDPVKDFADYSTQPDADAILVTHDHYDHLDIESVEELALEKTLIFANASTVEKLHGEADLMVNGDRRSLPFMEIEAVPAYNTTPDHLQFHPKDINNGYVLTFGGTRVLVAGDTEDIPELMAMRDIDIAFLPVNQPYTMTEEQAARVVEAIRPRIFYPYHYGQVEHKTDLDKLARLIAGTGVEMRIRPLE